MKTSVSDKLQKEAGYGVLTFRRSFDSPHSLISAGLSRRTVVLFRVSVSGLTGGFGLSWVADLLARLPAPAHSIRSVEALPSGSSGTTVIALVNIGFLRAAFREKVASEIMVDLAGEVIHSADCLFTSRLAKSWPPSFVAFLVNCRVAFLGDFGFTCAVI